MLSSQRDAIAGWALASPTWVKSSRLGQIRVIHTNNARSLSRSQRRGGARRKDVKLMMDKQVFSSERQLRLEHVGG
jgi:hypothetical protein